MMGCTPKNRYTLARLGQNTPNEVVTVSACGYGSPVIGQPTLAQLLHHSLCELHDLLGNAFDLQNFSLPRLLQSAQNFFFGVMNDVLQVPAQIVKRVQPMLKAINDKIKQIPVIKQLIDGAQYFIDRLKAALKDVYQYSKIFFLGLLGVAAYFIYTESQHGYPVTRTVARTAAARIP